MMYCQHNNLHYGNVIPERPIFISTQMYRYNCVDVVCAVMNNFLKVPVDKDMNK